MEYYCEVYQVLDSVPENPLLPGDNQYFNVKIEFENLHMSDDVNFEHYCYTIDHTVFNIPKEALEQETFMMLSHLGVPEDARDLVAEKILACADNMANITHKNLKILTMSVFISITWIHEDVNDDDWAEEESIVDPGHCLVPASKSAIDGLKSVKVEQEEKCGCVICLEDFVVDSKVVRMPCSHLFHRICLVNWLQRGHSCPLCRFQIPTSDIL